MRTLRQLLYLGFWMLPLQRLCTVVGLGVLAGLGSLLYGGSGFGLACMAWGCLIGFAPATVMGGACLRAVSASRQVGLAPHGRARLLFAAVAVMALIGSLLLLLQFLFSLGEIPAYRMGVSGYRGLFYATFATATWWTLASFFASRSPLGMLAVLVVSLVIFFAMDKLGLGTPAAQWNKPWGLALPLLLWTGFGTWFLRARRIAPPGWLLPGGQSVLAAVATTDATATGLSQRAALERLLLGGSTVPRLLLQWLLGVGLLLFLLMLMARDEDQAMIVAHMAFAGLVLCSAIVAIQSAAIARRARALWLPSGFSRSQLFAFAERKLLEFALGVVLMFTLFLLLLWNTQPVRPTMSLAQAVSAVLAPSLLLVSDALSRPRDWLRYLRWPAVMSLCVVISWNLLQIPDRGIWQSASQGWTWIVAALLIGVALRELARRRWQMADLPRAATSR
jgi:hypothetical protein